MNWCKPHWEELREAIKVRGLDGFGAQDGTAAANDVVAQLEGKDTPFDPLMGSFWQINNQMLEDVGLRAVGACPLCILVEDGQPETVANWVNGVTDSALAYAQEQGLIPKPS